MGNNPYFQAIKLGLQQANNYRGEMWLGISGKLVLVASLSVFWSAIAKETPDQNWKVLIAYLLIANGVKELIDANNIKFAGLMNDDIATGAISAVILRPINPVLFLYSKYFGIRGVQISMALILILIGLGISWPVKVSYLVFFCLTIIISIAVSYAINAIVGTFAFFVTQAHGLRLVIIHSIRILGGSTIPLYFFSDHIRNILYWTPLPALAYLPARVVQQGLTNETVLMMTSSIVWFVILMGVAKWLWKIGLIKYESYGA